MTDAIQVGTAPVLISAVVPSYNQPQRLRRALESIRAQTLADWEAIVVDDGSEPQHRRAVQEHLAEINDARIKAVYSLKNRGPARARNLGIRLSRGRYIAFLDNDDVWAPEKLARQSNDMLGSPAYMSCTGYQNSTENQIELSQVLPGPSVIYDDLLIQNVVGCSTVMLDTEQGGKTYFPDLPLRQDFAHWLAILRMGREVRGLAEPLTTRYVHEESLSRNKLRAARYTWRVYRDVERLTLLRSIWVFLHYAWKGIVRGP